MVYPTLIKAEGNMPLLKLVDVRNVCLCKLYRFGEYVDSLEPINYSFTTGNYVVLGDFGDGGWALTYTLSGEPEQEESYREGNIFLDGNDLGVKELQELTCYVGHITPDLMNYNNRTLKEILSLQVGIVQKTLSLDEVIDIFELSDRRLNSPLNLLSNEIWNATAAIGYCQNKIIYCFPWLNPHYIKTYLKQRLSTISKCVKKANGILILPTSSAHGLSKIIDVNNVIKIRRI